MTSLEKDLGFLLDWLCTEWGFCIPPADKVRISRSERLEAREFAIEVLKAEGFDPPEYEIEWMRRIKARFIKHFGRSVVSTDEYEG
jgi:hypothetical protein